MNHLLGLRPSVLLAAASLLALSASVAPAALADTPTTAPAAAPTCDGRAATVVGSPGARLHGTDGDDVVVTNGAVNTTSGRGDDLICVTGPTSRRDPVWVRTGTGADRVLDQTAVGATLPDGTAPVSVDLGGGDDTFRGSVTPESVSDHAGTTDIVADGPDDDVTIGAPSEAPVEALDGSVTVSGPRGTIFVYDSVTSETVLVGSPGLTTLDPFFFDPHSPWRVDAVTGVLRQNGVPRLSVEGITRFDLSSYRVTSFRGTEGPDALEATFSGSLDLGGGDDDVDAGIVSGHVDLGPGDDALQVFGLRDGAVVEGGAGHDRLDAAGNSATTVDAGAGTWSRQDRTATLNGFEGFVFDTIPAVTFRGTDADEQVRVRACSTDVSTAGGSDVVVLVAPSGYPACEQDSVVTAAGGPGDDVVRVRGRAGAEILRGGGGDDVLTGGRGDDVLLGGAGDDAADGGSGSDRCRTETKEACER